MNRRNFLNITLADFIVRAGYQMGKTPLLPLFAAALGASDILLGTIVSISTLTGMVSKPLFGFLSDRQGRRWWLLMGTFCFAFFPFFYGFVQTPGQLVLIRVLHGTATAIYGPVTVAYVAEQSSRHKGEMLGWFGIARSGGYIVGPAVAGWLLLSLDPAAVFTVIGGISLLAFIPILLLRDGVRDAAAEVPEPVPDPPPPRAMTFWPQIRTALAVSLATPAVWLAGGMEGLVYIATYAVKAFLPVYALTAGYSTATIGLFFSLQEGAHLLLRPVGGRVGDRMGYARAVALGMMGVAVALPLLGMVSRPWLLLGLSLVMGSAQALIFPATIALVAERVASRHVGTGMGVVGTLDNAGKVVGPVLGGLLVAGLGYAPMLRLLGLGLLVGAGLIWLSAAAPLGRRTPPVKSGAGD